jgi:hypothetical protein
MVIGDCSGNMTVMMIKVPTPDSPRGGQTISFGCIGSLTTFDLPLSG